MDTYRILAELRAERGRIDKAISALETVNSNRRRSVDQRPLTARKSRRVSAATRARMAAAQRARWAKVRQRGSKARRMSRAARKKIAAAQRARWARVRAQRQVQTRAA